MRFLLFLYPWLELLSLIQLGVETNALFAVAWVFFMFLLGGAMIRRVGTASVTRLREAQRTGVLQQSLLVDDMAVVIAALLLIIPGLVSDFFAVVVLIGPLRRGLARAIFGRGETETAFRHHDVYSSNSDEKQRHSEGAQSRRVTLEGDFTRIDESDRDPR